ncbi:MAG: phosphomannomutase/phosphoglucomutase [Candidatus Marinimicrobia bacterium]|nr:phosphomannomutase/phosphoglucomutase [Candidatus Neomarinimicrobiota bacterium]
MNKNIFREYDIRGVVETDFTDDVVINLGRAFGTFVIRSGGNSVALSGDVRLTTPSLISLFTQGLLSAGINITHLGIVPTPVNYFSMYHMNVDGAVQITGSHNPPEFNGFKFSLNKRAFYGAHIQNLRQLMETEDYESGAGTMMEIDILPDYHQMLKRKIQLQRPLKIVMDCGNACGAITGPAIFKELDVELTELYCDVDGRFPNHHPDPTEDHNLKEIVSVIKGGDFDMGLAFDGDADRVVAIDNQGQIIRADNMMALFLPEIITDGDGIVFDVKCSQALEDMILRYGGKPIMWKTGHSLIKEKMRTDNIKFAGEMSGHIFFADDFYGFDDAVYVALRLAQTLSRTDKRLSDLTADIPKYYSTAEMRLECPTDEEKVRIATQAEEYFPQHFDCIMVDGVRIKFGDGWGLVRSSNTQPVIVCRFEANTPERMLEIKKLVLDKLTEFGDISLHE